MKTQQVRFDRYAFILTSNRIGSASHGGTYGPQGRRRGSRVACGCQGQGDDASVAALARKGMHSIVEILMD